MRQVYGGELASSRCATAVHPTCDRSTFSDGEVDITFEWLRGRVRVRVRAHAELDLVDELLRLSHNNTLSLHLATGGAAVH